MSSIKVGGMHCPQCSEAVKKALEKASADDANVSIVDGVINWSGDLDMEDVKRIIDEQGYYTIPN